MNLTWEVWRVFGSNSFMPRLELTVSQETVTARQKSAEGIVGGI